MPFLAMVRIADVDTLRVIHSPVSGIKNFLSCKFGLNRRLVLTLEWETWFPLIARFPVKSQILDMDLVLVSFVLEATFGATASRNAEPGSS